MSRSAPDPIYTLRGSASPLSYLKFAGTDTLFSGNYDGVIHEWSMETKRIINKVTAHPGHSVLYLDLIDDTKMLTQGRDGLVKIWSRKSNGWSEIGMIKYCDTGFCGSCLLADGRLATPSSKQSEVDLYDLDTMKVITTLKPDVSKEKFGMCMKIKTFHENDGYKILIGYENGSVALWDTRQSSMVDSLIVHKDPVMCLDYSPILNKGFSGSATENLCSWTILDNKINKHMSISATNPGFNDTLVRKDGKIVVFAGWDGNIRIFGAKKMKPLAVLSYHKGSVHCLTFSEDNILACGSKDEQITLWDIYR